MNNKDLSSHLIKLQQNFQYCTNERKTISYIITPFFELLGFSSKNPLEFEEEVPLSLTKKNNYFIDILLKKDSKPLITLEAKQLGRDLKSNYGQLYDYFSHGNRDENYNTDFAVLTDGKKYLFYTDMEKHNVLDKEPFFVFDITNYNEEDLELLSYFYKDKIEKHSTKKEIEKVIKERELSNCLDSLLQNPNDSFIEHILKYIKKHEDINLDNFDAMSVIRNYLTEPEVNVENNVQRNILSENVNPTNSNINETIIVSAKEDGFNEVFINENRWYSVKIKKERLNDFKYIAVYRSKPVSAITHIAEIKEIIPYDEYGYQVIFKEKAIELDNPILYVKGKSFPPRAPVYTKQEILKNAKDLSDIIPLHNKKN